MKKLDKLNSLMGKKFRHKDHGYEFIFCTHKTEGDKITIVTDSTWLRTSFSDLEIFLEKYEEIDILEITSVPKVGMTTTNLPAMKTINTELIDKLKNALLDNIEKVQKSKDYIGQAKIVCDSVQGMVNLAKMELEIRTKIK